MRKFTRFMLVFFIIFFILSSIMIILGALILYKYSESHIEDDIINTVASHDRTKFYRFDHDDNNNRTAHEIQGVFLDNGIKSEHMYFEHIPVNMINAFVSVEDKRFFDHWGIDYKRSAFAIVNYIIKHDNSFGGSTITQQLVKNLTGNNKKNIKRKLTEAFCALDIEKNYDKTEILEMYLNIINLAHGCRGVSAASQYYFSKQPQELSLCECAAIAAITNNPSKYDPENHPNENKKRREIILKLMLDNDYISHAEYEMAVKEDLNINISYNNKNNINNWYIDAVMEDVIEDYALKYNISKQNASLLIYNGGYKIYTAMDAVIQNTLDDYFDDLNNFPSDNEGNKPLSSMIIIDPASGDILGIRGNIGKKNANRIQNYATQTKRPPGSTIKPLSIYAPAIEMGIIDWSSLVEDSPIRINSKTGAQWPSNANRKYNGNVTIKYAISNSLNTVAVKLLNKIGNENAYIFLNDKLNINSLDKNKDIGDAALALGQPSNGITLCELTAAYSIFSDGYYKKPKTYYKVTDTDGKIILSNNSDNEKTISNETASIMTKLLQTVITEGTAAGYINLPNDIEVAGKTGTTQFNNDKYFVGYTPTLLAGVWQGYEYPSPLDSFNGNQSIRIWNDIMTAIYSTNRIDNHRKEFEISQNVGEFSYNKKTGGPPSDFDDLSDIENGWFKISDH